jgi:hypothetical protein
VANIPTSPGNPLTLEPTETGISSLLTSAARTGSFYDQAGQALSDTGRRAASALQDIGDTAVNYVSQQQVSAGAPLFAKALSDLDEEWNIKVRGGKDQDGNVIPPADPNDPSIRAKFMQDRLPAVLDALRDGFTTDKSQAYAESQIDQLRQHFNIKTAADISTRARDVAKTNIDELTNTLSNAAYSDPTTAKTALGMLQHSVGEMVAGSNMNAADASRVSTEVLFEAERSVTRAAAAGMIALNPDAGIKEFSKPEYAKYISGSDLHALEQQARTVQSAMRTDATRQVALQKQQQQDKSDQAEGQYLVKLHDDNPSVSGTVTAQAIANDFTLTREARERMIGIVNREMKPETDAKVSAQTSVQIMRQLLDPNADVQAVRTAILDARTKDPGAPGSLTKADMADLQKQVDDLKTPQGAALAADRNEFFKQYGPTIDADMKLGEPTPLGAQGIYRAEKDARRQEQVLRQKGIDPHALYDPSSEYFLGKPAVIGKYRASLADTAAYKAQLNADKNRPLSTNLTGDGSTVTGVQTLDIPAGMSPADATKWAKDKGAQSGAKVKLPDGRIGTVP